MQHYKTNKVTTTELLTWISISRSSWYYQPTFGRKGIPPSTHTWKNDGRQVHNAKIVKEIKKILSNGLDFYGYEKVSWKLKEKGYIINHKKVYRLMKQEHLLLIKDRISTCGKRNFVQFRKIEATRPLEYLVMDIKYVYIHQEKRFCYLLSIMDVCTRFVLDHLFKPTIRKYDVVLLLDYILQGHDTRGIIIRNDNGSQFIAHQLREYINSRKMNQEFTHIATPQENGHIEALFSVLEREMIQRNWFDSFYHAKMKIAEYFKVYNYRRKHRSLKRMSPYQYLKRFFPEFSDKHPFVFSDSLSRVALDAGQDSEATCHALDKVKDENANFVSSENQKNLLN